jgi:hypothetical protein
MANNKKTVKPVKTKPKKKASKELIESQEISSEGGYVHGVYYSVEDAKRWEINTNEALYNCKNKLFSDRLDSQAVKSYIENLEDKVEQLERIVKVGDKLSKKKK